MGTPHGMRAFDYAGLRHGVTGPIAPRLARMHEAKLRQGGTPAAAAEAAWLLLHEVAAGIDPHDSRLVCTLDWLAAIAPKKRNRAIARGETQPRFRRHPALIETLAGSGRESLVTSLDQLHKLYSELRTTS